MNEFTYIAKFALEPTGTDALAARALAVTVAVGHFAFVVFEAAFLTLPAGDALAPAVDVIATPAAQYRTHAYQVETNHKTNAIQS